MVADEQVWRDVEHVVRHGASLRHRDHHLLPDRVGDWHIVVCIEDEVLRVLVLRRAHRREVYRRPARPGAE